jgi:ribosome recycling factor
MTDDLVSGLLEDARERMEKAVEAIRDQLASVRAGRASPSLLDRVSVDYYGTATPLKQLAQINAPEPRLLSIQPFDKSSIKAIERAISESDLGLQLPEMTEERRRDMVKVARQIAEDGRVQIRNIRRDVLQDLRELKDEGDVGADDEHRAEGDLQKVTDTRIAELDEALKVKESEILEV